MKADRLRRYDEESSRELPTKFDVLGGALVLLAFIGCGIAGGYIADAIAHPDSDYAYGDGLGRLILGFFIGAIAGRPAHRRRLDGARAPQMAPPIALEPLEIYGREERRSTRPPPTSATLTEPSGSTARHSPHSAERTTTRPDYGRTTTRTSTPHSCATPTATTSKPKPSATFRSDTHPKRVRPKV